MYAYIQNLYYMYVRIYTKSLLHVCMYIYKLFITCMYVYIQNLYYMYVRIYTKIFIFCTLAVYVSFVV